MRDRAQTRDGCHIDDAAAPAREHLLAEAAAQQERAEQVHIHDATPLRGGDVLGGDDLADAGVVDEHIGGAEGRGGLGDGALDEGLVGHIARERDRRAAGGTEFGEQRVGGLQVEEHDAMTGLRQQRRRRPSQALRGAGDDGGAHVVDGHLSQPCSPFSLRL